MSGCGEQNQNKSDKIFEGQNRDMIGRESERSWMEVQEVGNGGRSRGLHWWEVKRSALVGGQEVSTGGRSRGQQWDEKPV